MAKDFVSCMFAPLAALYDGASADRPPVPRVRLNDYRVSVPSL